MFDGPRFDFVVTFNIGPSISLALLSGFVCLTLKKGLPENSTQTRTAKIDTSPYLQQILAIACSNSDENSDRQLLIPKLKPM